MKASTVLTLGGLGALAWYLSRRGAARGVPSSPGVGTEASDGPRDVSQGVDFSFGDYWLTAGTGLRADRCSLPDDRQEAWSDGQKACAAAWHKARADVFYAQVWKPASRIPISSLTAEDFDRAARFLSNGFDRRNMPLTYGQNKAINDFNDSLTVANVFFFVGAAIGKVFGVSSSVDPGASASEAYTDFVESVKQAVTDDTSLIIDEAPSDPDTLAKHSVNSPFIDGGSPSGRSPSIDFGYDPIVYEWGHFYIRMRLLETTPYGTLRHPWVSREMGYSGPDDVTLTPEKVSIAARMYRTLDVIGAMLRPQRKARLYGSAPAEGIESVSISDLTIGYTLSNPSLYAYKVGAVELWGCVLPAAAEDVATDLANELGRDLASVDYVGARVPLPEALDRNDYVGPTKRAPLPTHGRAMDELSSANAGASPTTAPPLAVPSSKAAILKRRSL